MTRSMQAAKVLSSSPAEDYRREGFVVMRGIVPADDVRAVRADMHRLVTQQLAHHGLPIRGGNKPEDLHADLKTLFNHDLKTYLATLTLCAKLASLHTLYVHPNIQAFVRSIGLAFPVIQTAPVMHLMSHSLKVPNGYQGFGAHQDWPTLQGSLDTVTVWIPFITVDRNLFTMDIVPRSHNKGLLPYTRRDHIFEVNPDQYDEKDFVPMEAEEGDIVFMSSFAIHRSSLKGDERLRVSTSLRYENAADPTFIARAYPFAQKRSVIPELITPNFPSDEQVRKVYE